MPTPILATKLYIPRLRPNVVSRSRLIERLNEGLQRKLTLIAAPAGFGKTTLVSAWVARCDREVAWLSLDKGESDPTLFLTYLVAALQTIAPTIGEGVSGVLHSPQPPPPESMLTALLNDLTTISDQFVLVLDDYHVIDAQPVDHALTFLLDHLPPHMHLVMPSSFRKRATRFSCSSRLWRRKSREVKSLPYTSVPLSLKGLTHRVVWR